jgi:hypothetical protein
MEYEEILEKNPDITELVSYDINIGGDPEMLGENMLAVLYVQFEYFEKGVRIAVKLNDLVKDEINYYAKLVDYEPTITNELDRGMVVVKNTIHEVFELKMKDLLTGAREMVELSVSNKKMTFVNDNAKISIKTRKGTL